MEDCISGPSVQSPQAADFPRTLTLPTLLCASLCTGHSDTVINKEESGKSLCLLWGRRMGIPGPKSTLLTTHTPISVFCQQTRDNLGPNLLCLLQERVHLETFKPWLIPKAPVGFLSRSRVTGFWTMRKALCNTLYCSLHFRRASLYT